MKKLLFIALIMVGISASAQGEEFTIVKSDWESYPPAKHQWAKWQYKTLRLSDYVVIKKEGSVEELYQAIKRFIDLTWNDPDHVIKVDRENEYIRINGAHNRIWEFRFKENKIQYKTSIPKYYVAAKKPNGKIKDPWEPIMLSNAYYMPSFSVIGTTLGWGQVKRYVAEENAKVLLIKALDIIEAAQDDW